jgi:membrane-bound lytic murein transglycosylase C
MGNLNTKLTNRGISLSRVLVFIILAFIVFGYIAIKPGPVVAQQSYDDFKNRQEQDYRDFVEAEQAAFENYVKEVKRKWNEFQDSDRRDWCEYSSDLNTLSKVDFEHGEITIETIVAKSTRTVFKQASINIREKIEGLFQKDSLTNDIILENQVEFGSPPIIDSTNARLFAEEKVIPRATLQKETIMSEDGIERVKVTATFKMVPDHLKIRAEKYLPLVKQYCKKYKLDIPLVMAIIQTESFFNPRAKSPIPAFGLMQLVPHSGAREAYRFVYDEDIIVKPAYLYTPENNIQLGCAYLAKMRDHEFKGVKDKNKLRYCLVAAYNTGAGNVCKAIAGESKFQPAIEEINYMKPQRLYQILLEELPYRETREYLAKVETRRDYYQSWK